MAVLTTESVLFKGDGAETLAQQYEKMMAESLKLKVQTGQLSQQLKDGSFLKQANDIQRAGAELKKYREEQRKLWDDGRRQILQQRYGQTMGGLAYNAQRYGKPAMEMAKAVAGSTLGTAASFGLPVSVGAIAARGFSGTSQYARLDNEVERLSRHLASDLAPAMDWFTRQLNKVNRASDRIRSGNGSILDHFTANVPWMLAAGGATASIAGVASRMGYRPIGAAAGFAGDILSGLVQGRAASFSQNLAAASRPSATPFGLTGAKVNVGSTLGKDAALAAGGGFAASAGLRGAARFAGPIGLAYLAYETQDTIRHYNPYENAADDRPGKKQREDELKRKDERTWFQRNFPNVSWTVGLSGGGPPGEVAERKERKNGGPVVVTAETGQKAGMTDIYEELQSAFGKLTTEKGDKGYENKAQEENTKALKDVADHLRAFRNKMGI